jgi:hypothetical protein
MATRTDRQCALHTHIVVACNARSVQRQGVNKCEATMKTHRICSAGSAGIHTLLQGSTLTHCSVAYEPHRHKVIVLAWLTTTSTPIHLCAMHGMHVWLPTAAETDALVWLMPLALSSSIEHHQQQHIATVHTRLNLQLPALRHVTLQQHAAPNMRKHKAQTYTSK